ncbi:SUKH-4 family immunity protein [Streptomyces catenulae]|uniref:SUKH-4 family immunity protein n=1 Tax=Streptomyces catenulae TaxID=66875 RepID=A0ABV2Z323_9ACTN|nr:SUKH-4 family immunity protein [Streptomyces catenulae]
MVTFAQAQERAELWVNGDVPAQLQREVRVREFDLGFVAWAEDREDGPRSDGGRSRLVIARDSGETTLWPGLPVGEVIRRYEEEYGAAAARPAAVSAAPRIDLEATSFLLTPPEWLQEAADARAEASGGAAAAPPAPAAPAPAVGGDGAADAWAGVNVTPGAEGGPGAAEGDDRSVAPPQTVFAPPLAGLDEVGEEDGADTAARRSSPEAKTQLLQGGSQLPPTQVTPALEREAPAGAPSADGASGATAGGSGAGSAGAAPVPPMPPAPPVGPGWADLPPPSGPPVAEVPPPQGATPAASGPPAPPATGGVHAAATVLAAGAAVPAEAAVPPPPPGVPGAEKAASGGAGAPAGGYVPTQLVSQLDGDGLDLSAVDGADGASGGAGSGASGGGVHAAATMLASGAALPDPATGGPGAGGPAVPPPPGPPGAPKGAGGAKSGAAGGSSGASPDGPPPPPPPVPAVGGAGGGVHAAATMLASGAAAPGPGASGPAAPGAPQGAGPAAPPPAPPQAPGPVAPPQAPGPAAPPQAAPPQAAPPQGAPPQGAPGGYGYPPAPGGVPTVGPGYMAVLSYRAPDGSEQKIVRRSAPGTPHPEWQLLHELRGMNIPPQQVLELHTELESCEVPGGYCARLVRDTWPQVRISHTAAYGRDHASRQQGVRHLVEHQGELHQVADGPARPAPVRAPLPHPSQVQPVPPAPPQVVGQELEQAFGPQALFRFDQRAVSRQGVPEVVAQMLVWAGLPVDFGPFFWAQAQPGRPVPTLAELAAERGVQPSADAGSYLVMGNDYGRQLCVQYGTAHLVAVPLEGVPGGQPAPAQFVNSGLPEFTRCLAMLGRMWRLRYGLTPEQAGRWTVDFQAQLVALDPAALGSPETWWSVLLEQMWDGLL